MNTLPVRADDTPQFWAWLLRPFYGWAPDLSPWSVAIGRAMYRMARRAEK